MNKSFTRLWIARAAASVLALSACAITLPAFAQAGEATEVEALAYTSYVTEVDDGVLLAGSLELDVLRDVHQGPVQIIDLRTEPEGTLEEADQAEALGMSYVNIPVSSATVDPVQVEALRNVLASSDPNALVIVHCATGNRAGMLWGAAQLADGVPLAEVQARVSGIMTKQPVIDGLDAYAKTLDAGL